MNASRPSLVYADESGNIIDHPELEMVGASARRHQRLQPGEWIPLPAGSELFLLPGRVPVGYNPSRRRFEVVEDDPYQPRRSVQAVAAFVAPAHTQLYSPAYRSRPNAPLLPLFAYTAVGWYRDGFVTTAVRVDPDPRQELSGFDLEKIERNVQKRTHREHHNRLIHHLSRCALGYGCPAAKNLFMDRYEAPLPSSPACNARCLGCISLQQGSGLCATQDRITFVPTPDEIVEVALPHLRQAARAVVSFGQGCEGEPLLQAETLAEAIRMMRRDSSRGTINLNTNGSLPAAIAEMRRAGLDSMRVSLNSCRPRYYHAYYRPGNYSFADVVESIREMKRRDGFVSINYFVLPGFTDDPGEFKALCDLIEQTGLDLIQLRNFNIDPEWYEKTIEFRPGGKPIGILPLMQELRKRYPRLRLGYFNPCLDPDA